MKKEGEVKRKLVFGLEGRGERKVRVFPGGAREEEERAIQFWKKGVF